MKNILFFLFVKYAFGQSSSSVECPYSSDCFFNNHDCFFSNFSDGKCDLVNNHYDCAYDGGDCCEITCVDRTFTCGPDYNNCLFETPTSSGPSSSTSLPTPDFSSSTPTSPGSSSSIGIISGVISSIVVISVIILGCFIKKKKNNKRVMDSPVNHGDIESQEIDGKTNDGNKSWVTNSTSEMSTDESISKKGPGIGQAILDSAINIAACSQVPGVSEVANAVKILVELHLNKNSNKKLTEEKLRRCRSIIIVIKSAEKIIMNRDDTVGKAGLQMLEDVHVSIMDMVELIESYTVKNKLYKLTTSNLFKKRHDELEASVFRAIDVLQLGLHVQVGNNICEFKNDVNVIKDNAQEIAEARRCRRQRKLDNLEIPSEDVEITDELLGKGGFGEVYYADYNGKNSAAKVFRLPEDCQDSVRKSFLLELEMMTRLRSPYTVNVFGAISSLNDKFVIVMELISGGSLRNLLKRSSSKVDACMIVGDVCAGMQFLHSKNTIHGDLKSANILIEKGRAKIADFGTSRRAHVTMSTGLVTMNTALSKNTQMSLAWSAPEIVDCCSVSTYPTDVYSFGMVIYEVLTRKLPWHNLVRPSDIISRVIHGIRPDDVPENSPEFLKSIMESCWAQKFEERPTFDFILNYMKGNGWNFYLRDHLRKH